MSSRTGRRLRAWALVALCGFPVSANLACYGRGGFLLFQAAVLTALVVSATAPPPPRVVEVPPPRPGYVWQPGFWTLQGNQWVWVNGYWIPLHPGYSWIPQHWEQAPDGSWQLIPAQWVPAR
jgi:hypothetical protein